MGKLFKHMPRWTPKSETFDKMGAKRPIHFREGYCVGGDHEQHYRALTSSSTKDHWWDYGLVTLTTGSPDVTQFRLIWLWRKALSGYNEIHRSETVCYSITANRGPEGNGLASAHLIFDVRALPDFETLERCWLRASDHVGGDWELTSAGGRATLYWSQNATEPYAIEEHYLYKWERAELVRAKQEAEELTPLPPTPPREHKPAIITRRNGEEIKRQTRPF